MYFPTNEERAPWVYRRHPLSLAANVSETLMNIFAIEREVFNDDAEEFTILHSGASSKVFPPASFSRTASDPDDFHFRHL